MVTMDVDGIAIEVYRKKMKNMILRVCPPLGIVKISAPMRSSNIAIRRFVATQVDWIKKQQLAYQQAPPEPIHHYSKRDRQLLLSKIQMLIPHWEEKIGVRVAQFQIRLMKTLWGSCHPSKRKICLNLALIRYPAICLEYVIVHEMVHFLEGSHNARFKALMDKFMPDWRNAKRLLC